MEFLTDNNLLLTLIVFSPVVAAVILVMFPDDAKEEADKDRVLWTTDRESIVGLGYNRNLIRPAEVPKSFADLAKAENKGKIAVSGDVTGVRFIGAMILPPDQFTSYGLAFSGGSVGNRSGQRGDSVRAVLR